MGVSGERASRMGWATRAWGARLGAGLAAGAVVLAARRRRETADLSGQVALVTGASRGLGLLLARELAARGCRLVICARGADDLRAAEADLVRRGATVLAVPCDLAEQAQAERLVERAVQRFGRLDLLVNNAGIVQVGPVTAESAGQFTSAVDIMLLAPVYLTLKALPYLRLSPSGRIVNITSIGGRVSVPHLLPYSTAKFGAVGFSQGLRAELAGRGAGPRISVTTVVPGLMRTGSPNRALFTGQASREFAWFAVGASAPLVAMDAQRAARRIVNAAVARRAVVTLTPLAVVAARVAGLAPATTTRLLGVMARLLPRASAGPSPLRSGQDVAAGSPSRLREAVTVLGRRAAERYQPDGGAAALNRGAAESGG